MTLLATALWSQSALRFVLLGAATGSLTALVALGIVLVYRTSGVLNFSAGALGGIAAYVCYDMRDGGMPTALAVALGLLVGVGLGLLTYVVMALLRDASRRHRQILKRPQNDCLQSGRQLERDEECAQTGDTKNARVLTQPQQQFVVVGLDLDRADLLAAKSHRP